MGNTVHHANGGVPAQQYLAEVPTPTHVPAGGGGVDQTPAGPTPGGDPKVAFEREKFEFWVSGFQHGQGNPQLTLSGAQIAPARADLVLDVNGAAKVLWLNGPVAPPGNYRVEVRQGDDAAALEFRMGAGQAPKLLLHTHPTNDFRNYLVMLRGMRREPPYTVDVFTGDGEREADGGLTYRHAARFILPIQAQSDEDGSPVVSEEDARKNKRLAGYRAGSMVLDPEAVAPLEAADSGSAKELLIYADLHEGSDSPIKLLDANGVETGWSAEAQATALIVRNNLGVTPSRTTIETDPFEGSLPAGALMVTYQGEPYTPVEIVIELANGERIRRHLMPDQYGRSVEPFSVPALPGSNAVSIGEYSVPFIFPALQDAPAAGGVLPIAPIQPPPIDPDIENMPEAEPGPGGQE